MLCEHHELTGLFACIGPHADIMAMVRENLRRSRRSRDDLKGAGCSVMFIISPVIPSPTQTTGTASSSINANHEALQCCSVVYPYRCHVSQCLRAQRLQRDRSSSRERRRYFIYPRSGRTVEAFLNQCLLTSCRFYASKAQVELQAHD
jgi:hypothetical protein